MDILVSSNLERFRLRINRTYSKETNALMTSLKENGSYSVRIQIQLYSNNLRKPMLAKRNVSNDS